MLARDAIRIIKERLSIVDIARRYVDLKPNGPRFVAPCPFHQETKPSFYVNPDKGLFYCFGCHESGDVLDFYNKINGLDFREGLEQLAAEAGLEIDSWNDDAIDNGAEKRKIGEKQQILRMHDAACAHFIANLASPAGKECREYIKKRGISPEIQERFGLGWASMEWRSLAGALARQNFDPSLAHAAGLLGKSDNGSFYDRFRGRFMFPIKNLSNQIIAFGGRIIREADEAKYINSPDSPIYKKGEHLYGLAQARRGISAKGQALLTEGYMDVLTLHQYGYGNGVGVLGTALTEAQVKRLSGFTSRVALLFDGDGPGRKAALRSCEMFLCRGLSCVVVLMPEGEDIDSLLRSKGNAAFDKLLEKAPDGLRFCVNALKSLAPREAIDWARNFLSHIQIPELLSPYASTLSQRLGIAEDTLRESAAETARHSDNEQPAGQSLNLLNMRDMQIMIFVVRYPERLAELKELGANMALNSQRARQFWNILERWGPEDAVYHLDGRQKNFWFKHRGPDAPPLNNGDFELACLRGELAKFHESTQKNSLSTALAENRGASDFIRDMEYLRALQESLEKRHEQS